MTPYFELLDLPALPDHLEQEIQQRLHSPELYRAQKSHQHTPGFAEYSSRQVTHVTGKLATSVVADRYLASDELKAWVQTNIHATPLSVNISITNQASNTFGPHVDFNRNESLLYIIEAGGANVTTKWWQQHGHPIRRPEMQDITNGWATGFNNYSQLTERASICIPPRTWIRFCDTAILHSVENLETQRLTIQIPIR